MNNLLYLISIGNEGKLEESWRNISRDYGHKHRFEHYVLSGKPYENNKLSYYFDSFTSSRPGLAYLNLYQVLESEMPIDVNRRGREPEISRLRRLFNRAVCLREIGDDFKELKKYTRTSEIQDKYRLPAIEHRRSSLADAIYKVRNLVAHSKKSEQRLVAFSKDEYELIPHYLNVMQKVAIQIIEKYK